MSGSKATAETKGKSTKPKEARPRIASVAPVKRPAQKEQKTGKVNHEKLVCRYCGSDDLSPSFIERRDRRCRKCFSKRYRSAARGKWKRQKR